MIMKLQSYQDLIVWQKSIELTKLIYSFTKTFPKEEVYGLISQMRRAAVAIPSNIAEGYSRNHRGEYIHFLSIAFASAAELETQLIIAKELNYLNIQIFNESYKPLKEVLMMLNKLIRVLKESK